MSATNLLFADAPRKHDIEAVRPHKRKHLKPFVFAVKGGDVTIHGANFKEARSRFEAMTGGTVAFIPVTAEKFTKAKKKQLKKDMH